ncbi:ankyrin repeat domain-containing protein [Butyrivibrio sp. VCB2001]|uniref:ankyrin repeat domain-containing protein n=1 Tax=Butyrivibrio sp. VCB2001 TaxID=1280667 RepID=UPI0004009A8B|nr:ankyrin repeat domain-containing protein [Butyrivibrio sp. VCB2001]
MITKEDKQRIRQIIKQGDLESLKDALEDNQELLNAETAFGTWLEVAAEFGQLDIVRYLIGRGIDVNKSCGIVEGGPINTTSFYGHLDVLKLLMENGAVPDVSTAEKNPLFAAVYNGHLDVVKFLVENGIDYKASYTVGSIDKCDACEYARQYGRKEIVEYLQSKM